MIEALRELRKEPIFWIGVFIKFFLVLFAVPWTHQNWFVPFLESGVSFDPWTAHVKSGGNLLAFPYGYAMYFAYLPLFLFGKLFGFSQASFVSLHLTNFVFDILLLLVLKNLLQSKTKLLLLFYWLSPITIYVCYFHGQTDLIPVFFLVAGLQLLKNEKAILAGLLLSLAVSAKLSMSIAIPFIFIYLWRNPRQRSKLAPFVSSFLALSFVFYLPVLFSSGYFQMVFGSKEIQKIYNVAIDLQDGRKIYLLPIVYLLVLYTAWRMERLSADLLFALLGIAFFLFLILTPAAVNWYVWIVPMLVAFQISTGLITGLLGTIFSMLFVFTQVLFSSGSNLPFFNIDYSTPLLVGTNYAHFHSLLITTTCLLALLLCIRMFIYGIGRTDFYRLSRKPITLGIAGDSGSGKDTLVAAIADLFGTECVSNISGDDYHKWDRKAPMWKALTHLDPRANNLQSFAQDVLALMDGKSVVYRHYDHDTGKFTRAKKMKKNNVIIASGLHALFIPQLKEKLDVGIYLDMDEDLRKHLKIKRDVENRGKNMNEVLKSIAKREPDSNRFVKPQIESADIVFSIIPRDKSNIDDSLNNNGLKLEVLIKRGMYYEDLITKLIGLCGMHVDFNLEDASGAVKLIIEGEVTSEDIEVTAKDIVSDLEELVSSKPMFYDGMLGVMQLITLSQIYDTLKSRVLYGYNYSYN